MWIAGGGTGGHVYPALAVVKAMRSAHPAVDLRWIGSRGGVEEELVTRESVPFETIPAGGLHGVGLVRAAQNALRLLAGVARALKLARVDRPQALLVTGGFVSVPVAIACWLRRAPIVVY